MRTFLLIFFITITIQASAEPIKFVYHEAFRPCSWKENNTMKGILIDVINEAVVNRMNLEVTHEGLPWKRAQSHVQKGKADAFITVPTTARLAYTIKNTEPVININLSIVTRKDHPKLKQMKSITTIEQLKNYSLTNYLGNGWAKQNLNHLKVHCLPTIDLLFPFLIAGRADIAIISDKLSKYEIKRLGYEKKLAVLPNAIASVPFHLCIRKTSEHTSILKRFDSVIKEMTADGTLQKIEAAYY